MPVPLSPSPPPLPKGLWGEGESAVGSTCATHAVSLSPIGLGERVGVRGLLLLHGICSNEQVFRHPRGRNWVDLLSPHFRCHLGRLRSGRPPVGEAGWDFDDHLAELPAIWKEAVEHLGEPLGVVGHSMGGMLALIGQARGLFAASRIAVVAAPLGFPAVPFYPPLMRGVLGVTEFLGVRRIPIRFLGRLVCAWFRLRGRGNDRLTALFHLLIRRAGVDVPRETLAQACRWVGGGAFCDRTGTRDYAQELAQIRVPVLMMGGGADRIAPPTCMVEGFARLGSVGKKWVVVPGATHLDLVGGPHAVEVATHLTEWFSPSP